MELKHILSVLKRNKVIGLLIVLQIAVTLMIVSNSVFISMGVLQGWLTPTNLKAENLVVVWNRFYDPSLDLELTVREDVARLNAIPGVIAATSTVEAPFESSSYSRFAFTEDSETAQRHRVSLFDFNESGPDMLGVELLEGRWYRDEEVMRGYIDDIHFPAVTLISETMAAVLFPGESALGKTIYFNVNGREGAQIIGIYQDFMGGDSVVYNNIPYQTAIRPMVAWGEDHRSNYLIKVEQGMAPSLLASIEEILYQTEGRYITLTEVLTRTHKRLYDGRSSFAFTMLTISLIGLIITALGIVGLVGLSVSQRTVQIGIRRALGASRWQVVRYFLIENSILTLLGMALGLILSYGLNYILVTEFRQPSLIKLHYWLIIGLLIWVMNMMVTRIPASRAAKVDPAIVTRAA